MELKTEPSPGGTVWYSRPCAPGHGLEYQTVPPDDGFRRSWTHGNELERVGAKRPWRFLQEGAGLCDTMDAAGYRGGRCADGHRSGGRPEHGRRRADGRRWGHDAADHAAAGQS